MKLTRMTPVHASPASDGARRLFAALTAAVCAIAPLALVVPQVASADSVSAVTGELCTPTTLELGDTTATSTTDTGVATYVGGNMYIGDPTSDWTTANPRGSYAAEAEGLTLVRKNFYANPLKGANQSKGFFTFGTVAFGAHFRPGGRATTLAIGGYAQAWNYSAGVGQEYSLVNKESWATTAYGALIGKYNGDLWGTATGGSVKMYTYDHYLYEETPQIVPNSPLVQNDSFQTYLADGTTTKDYSNYGTTLSDLSSQLDRLSINGTTTVGTAGAQSSYTKYKYDGTVKASFNIADGAEKLITFTGDNVSAMQVFTVKASDLSSDGFKGLDFAFEKIPGSRFKCNGVVCGC